MPRCQIDTVHLQIYNPSPSFGTESVSMLLGLASRQARGGIHTFVTSVLIEPPHKATS